MTLLTFIFIVLLVATWRMSHQLDPLSQAEQHYAQGDISRDEYSLLMDVFYCRQM